MCRKCLEYKPENENRMYIGMTRTSVDNRMLGHLKYQSVKLVKCPLYGHDCESHNGVPQQYLTDIITSEKIIVGLNRFEGLHIQRNNGPVSLNERNKRERERMMEITATRVS